MNFIVQLWGMEGKWLPTTYPESFWRTLRCYINANRMFPGMRYRIKRVTKDMITPRRSQ